MTTVALGNKRLLHLADLLDVADAAHRKAGEPTYDQSTITHGCGTPGCAWGHWIESPARRARIVRELSSIPQSILCAEPEFALNAGDVTELFAVNGCGMARSAKQAAKYIRRFVARRVKAAQS